MGKTFSEWIKERRVTIPLPSGIDAGLRLPSGFKLAKMGPLPKIEEIEGSRNVEISRRYVEACLVSLGEEKDPIDRGLVEPDDFSTDDLNAIVDAVVSLVPKREVVDEAVPLAGTDSQNESLSSSTG
jgi:hypothetical protein